MAATLGIVPVGAGAGVLLALFSLTASFFTTGRSNLLAMSF